MFSPPRPHQRSQLGGLCCGEWHRASDHDQLVAAATAGDDRRQGSGVGRAVCATGSAGRWRWIYWINCRLVQVRQVVGEPSPTKGCLLYQSAYAPPGQLSEGEPSPKGGGRASGLASRCTGESSMCRKRACDSRPIDVQALALQHSHRDGPAVAAAVRRHREAVRCSVTTAGSWWVVSRASSASWPVGNGPSLHTRQATA